MADTNDPLTEFLERERNDLAGLEDDTGFEGIKFYFVNMTFELLIFKTTRFTTTSPAEYNTFLIILKLLVK